MKNVVIFEKLGKVQSYRLRFALYLTMVPLVGTAILTLQLLIFSMLNLYYLEGNGLIIDDRIREAYYQQVFGQVAPLLVSLLGLVAVSFVVSMIAMRWATSPFDAAEKAIRLYQKDSGPIKLTASWMSENTLLDRGVQAFLNQLSTGQPQKEFQRKNPLFHINLSFLLRFTAIYLILAIVTGLILGTLLSEAFTKIVSLAINLLQRQVIQGHYFTAQEQVLTLGVYVTVFVSVAVYVAIGYQVANYMSTMVMVFYRAFKEQRFPIHLRKTDIYLSLATAVNEKVEQFKKNK